MPTIERGICPSCSETVYRLSVDDAVKIPRNVIEPSAMIYLSEPVAGYSQMRPLPGTACLYFYQETGYSLREWLEKNKIPYEIQSSFGTPDLDIWEAIERTEEESKLLSDGGNGDFYRRKPYAD